MAATVARASIMPVNMLYLFPGEGAVNGAACIGFYGELYVYERTIYLIAREIAGNSILRAAEKLPLAFGKSIANGSINCGEIGRPSGDNEVGTEIAEAIDGYLVVGNLIETDISGEGSQVKVFIVVNGVVQGIVSYKKVGRIEASSIIGFAGEIPVIVYGIGVVTIGVVDARVIYRGRICPFFTGQAADDGKQDE